jgi:hypothetical protein
VDHAQFVFVDLLDLQEMARLRHGDQRQQLCCALACVIMLGALVGVGVMTIRVTSCLRTAYRIHLTSIARTGFWKTNQTKQKVPLAQQGKQPKPCKKNAGNTLLTRDERPRRHRKFETLPKSLEADGCQKYG